mgnify:CR=1 FL=1
MTVGGDSAQTVEPGPPAPPDPDSTPESQTQSPEVHMMSWSLVGDPAGGPFKNKRSIIGGPIRVYFLKPVVICEFLLRTRDVREG